MKLSDSCHDLVPKPVRAPQPVARKTQALSNHKQKIIAACHAAIAQFTYGERHAQVLCCLLNSMSRAKPSRLDLVMSLTGIVCQAVRGKVMAADILVASAVALMETGIYTFDHGLDGEIAPELHQLGKGALLLGATSLIGHLPLQVLVRGLPATKARTLSEMIVEAQAKIAAGQIDDIHLSFDKIIASQTLFDIVAQKTGERRALYTAMAAFAAGANKTELANYAAFGRLIGIARQVRSDLLDLIGDQPSRDLAAGIQTLPIGYFFEKASPPAKRQMQQSLGLVDLGQRQRAVVTLLARQKTVHLVVGVVQDQCEQALALIPQLSAHSKGRLLLADLVQKSAFFPLQMPPSLTYHA